LTGSVPTIRPSTSYANIDFGEKCIKGNAPGWGIIWQLMDRDLICDAIAKSSNGISQVEDRTFVAAEDAYEGTLGRTALDQIDLHFLRREVSMSAYDNPQQFARPSLIS
jgi:hypothetical protein